MPKFIYVFSRKDKEKLESLGYRLVTKDGKRGFFIFENTPDLKFDVGDVSYVLSDSITL